MASSNPATSSYASSRGAAGSHGHERMANAPDVARLSAAKEKEMELEREMEETDAVILPQVETEPQGEGGEAEKGAVPHPMDPNQFPDGGLTAWMVVLGGFCSLFCSFGWINCIGIFQDYYQTHQLAQYSSSTISWIPSLEAFMMFFGGPIIGKIYDNYGPRLLLLGGTFLHVFGLMMTSLATEYYQFLLAQGVCSPIGASMLFYPAMSCVATWFHRRRALAFGVTVAGSSTGGVVLPIMVDRLIPEVGYAWAMRIAAFLILGLMIVANLTLRSRLPPSPKPFRLRDFVTPLTELPFFLLTLGCFLFFLGMFLPINFLVLQAQHQGMSAALATYLVAILNAASLFGRVLPGYVGDRLGRFNVHIILCIFTGVIDLALWIPAKTNAPIIVFAALYGFGSGAFVSLVPALIAQISDIRAIGVRTGAVFAIISVAALVGNPIGGALIDRWDGAYTGLQIFCGVVQLAGAVAFVAARVALKGFRVKVKV